MSKSRIPGYVPLTSHELGQPMTHHRGSDGDGDRSGGRSSDGNGRGRGGPRKNRNSGPGNRSKRPSNRRSNNTGGFKKNRSQEN